MTSPFATMTSFGPPPGFTPPFSSSPTSAPSSSSSNGDDGLFSADHPWAWVLIPVALLSTLGLLAACLHNSRRRRAARKQAATTLLLNHPRRPGPPDSTQVTIRDLESGWVIPGREAARWAWPPPAMREEGLNELGEAPPPYENHKEKAAAVELGGEGEVREIGEGSSTQIGLMELDGREVVVGEERSWVEGVDDEIDTRRVGPDGEDGEVDKEGRGSDGGSEDEEERGHRERERKRERGSSSTDRAYDVAEEVVITQPPPAVLRETDSGRQQQRVDDGKGKRV
ncbi:uncharacterized protein QC763_202055 [Podospora pseudopauciseta]|uniref:Uncharacterized protein n=1 Tax=Podospora pseudopauciseta TaxID=2093780 RepID=A0ABR0HNF3_9PEZI|nr:hypothetical protein QC763_202055 [Podospora pseudopauciseta]